MAPILPSELISEQVAKRLIVALDYPDAQAALDCAEHLKPLGVTFKVGMQLFYQAGMSFVQQLQADGNRVFLDLKLHDIPNTVEKATESLVSQGVIFFNVHAQGGPEMMAASAEAAKKIAAQKGLPEATVIAVTLLTSLNQQHLTAHLKTSLSTTAYAVHLAQSAKKSGLQGVVCSAQEAKAIRAECGSDFILITPGIRPEGSATQDQSRVFTPQKAIEAGSTYLVVGRPITEAVNPMDAASNILKEMNTAIQNSALNVLDERTV